jgi:hypothetical protein
MYITDPGSSGSEFSPGYGSSSCIDIMHPHKTLHLNSKILAVCDYLHLLLNKITWILHSDNGFGDPDPVPYTDKFGIWNTALYENMHERGKKLCSLLLFHHF